MGVVWARPGQDPLDWKAPEFKSSQLLPQSEPRLVASGNAKEGSGPYLQREALYLVSSVSGLRFN